MVSASTNRLRKKVTIALPFVAILFGCIYILLKMAMRANNDFDFRLWSMDMQLVAAGIVFCAAWGIYIILTR